MTVSASLESIYVPSVANEVSLQVIVRLLPVVGENVRLCHGNIPIYLAQMVRDHVTCASELPEERKAPTYELICGSGEANMMINGAVVVATADEVRIDSIDATAVSRYHIENCLAVRQVPHRLSCVCWVGPVIHRFNLSATSSMMRKASSSEPPPTPQAASVTPAASYSSIRSGFGASARMIGRPLRPAACHA
ncbi:hypothetical protein DFR67_113113 [Williamsia limnetica]|uniref:Uncharacterized protein n=1 Tax=Williamsia limnetica TaxID=882452 RepID=A0A318RE76_WILLI|nr:hypothetical protein DFR67_113113 [Williamsia limnetica]